MAILVLAVATSTNVHAQTYSVLFNFNNSGGGTTGTNSGPAFPGVVAQGRDGNLYSTTARGGVNQSGVGDIFQVTPAGTQKIVHTFSLGVAPGSPYEPQSGLTLGTDGFFYGTTTAENDFLGSVFTADSSGNGVAPLERGPFPEYWPFRGARARARGNGQNSGKAPLSPRMHRAARSPRTARWCL